MKTFASILLGTVWLVLTISGLIALASYNQKPGDADQSPQQWPVKSHLNRSKTSPTLVVFLHPKCSCSHATLEELDSVMAKSPKNLKVLAVFIRPEGWKSELEDSLWDRAAAIPGVKLVVDEGGKEAKLFGALTSGHTVLYGPEGDLHFHGGITSGRGHMGDNAGQLALVEYLRSGAESINATNVYGCGIFSSSLMTAVNYAWNLVLK